MREHDENCMRKQFWEAGEWQCPCTCDPAKGDDLQAKLDAAQETLIEAGIATGTMLCELHDEVRARIKERDELQTLYDREVQGGLDLRAELRDMEHLKDDRERSLAYALDGVKRLEEELAAERALRP